MAASSLAIRPRQHQRRSTRSRRPTSGLPRRTGQPLAMDHATSPRIHGRTPQLRPAPKATATLGGRPLRHCVWATACRSAPARSEKIRPPTSIGGRGSTRVASWVAEKFSWSGMSSAVRCRTQGAFAPRPHVPVIVCVGMTMTIACAFCARSAWLERCSGHTLLQSEAISGGVVTPAASERVDLMPLPPCYREHSSGRRVGESGGVPAIKPLTVRTRRPFPGYSNVVDRPARQVRRDIRGHTSEPRCLPLHAIYCEIR
jgi:hypothetical protein